MFIINCLILKGAVMNKWSGGILISILITVIMCAGCIDPYVRTADAVLFKLSNDGEIEWESIISCPDIFHTSPFIRINAVGIPGDRYFVMVGYPGQSLETITRAVVLDERGNPEYDAVVPAVDAELLDLIVTGDDSVLAFSRDGTIYTFNSSGTLVSAYGLSDFDQTSMNSGSYNSFVSSSNGDLFFAGTDEKPGYIHVLRVSLQDLNSEETKYEIGGMPWVHSIALTNDSGFLIGGSYSDSGSFPYSKPWAAKTDREGGLVWEKKLGSLNNSLLGFYEGKGGDCHVYYTSSVIDDTGSGCDGYTEDILGKNGELKDSVNYSFAAGYPRLIAESGLFFMDYIYETDGGEDCEKGTGLQVTKLNVNGEKEWETLYECTDTGKTSSNIGSGIISTDDGGYLVTGTRYYF